MAYGHGACNLLLDAMSGSICRALADQLEGNEEEHQKYRSMVVQYIVKNRETFEPFIEDDVPFDEYCQSMETDGTWAGHMELQAASLVTHSNICIHRHMSPRWYIRNFDYHEARMIHLSYHDGEHYNGVRLKEDSCIGSARPIIIKADADISAASIQSKTVTSKLKGAAGIINAGSIKLVMAGSGCENSEKVEEVVLLQVGGDVDAAIEFLIAEQGTETEEYSVKNNNAEMSYVVMYCLLDRGVFNLTTVMLILTSVIAQVTVFHVNQTVDSKRGRKERKQGKKGEASSTLSACVSDGGPPDMGALCI
ncbi:OVARIAN TUMOR DOMAIN-containing deubiquitinating enzyme 7 [Citrus sinensis]|uniref:OVARIAN TUMOR DOMAIN-containing deubiquitinating enzyme 7 n=1 Tax=Citrus sinensis TaxID=2711 RepID=A0ACB8J278_CITSI|nr:OVARIAN TUMOR DOMAIN-containing deubiquitinating enzyme 7 [Citrus sinensis]